MTEIHFTGQQSKRREEGVEKLPWQNQCTWCSISQEIKRFNFKIHSQITRDFVSLESPISTQFVSSYGSLTPTKTVFSVNKPQNVF